MQTFVKNHLPLIIDRLKNVTVTCYDGLEVIKDHDSADTLFYVDPPYLPSTRTAPNTYAVEMTEKQHQELAAVLNKAQGKVVLSGYYSTLYAKLYSGWNLDLKDMPNHAAQGKKKQRRVECLWMNY